MLAQLGLARQLEAEVSGVVAVDGRSEVRVRRLRQLRLLVQQGEDTLRLGLNQVDAVLRSRHININNR